VLRLVLGIGTVGMCGWHQDFAFERPVSSRLGENRLTDQQWRRRFVATVVIDAPQRRLAVELLDDRQHHPRRVIHRRGIAAPIVGELYRYALLQPAQETPEDSVGALVEQPAKSQQHVPWTQRPHALLKLAERPAARIERRQFVLFSL